VASIGSPGLAIRRRKMKTPRFLSLEPGRLILSLILLSQLEMMTRKGDRFHSGVGGQQQQQIGVAPAALSASGVGK
jgi:hypothetical protein